MRTTTAKIELFKNAFDWLEFAQNWKAKITAETKDDGEVVFGVTWWSGSEYPEEAGKAADQILRSSYIARFLNNQGLSIDPENDKKRYSRKQEDDSLPILIKAIKNFETTTIINHFTVEEEAE